MKIPEYCHQAASCLLSAASTAVDAARWVRKCSAAPGLSTDQRVGWLRSLSSSGMTRLEKTAIMETLSHNLSLFLSPFSLLTNFYCAWFEKRRLNIS